MPLTLLGSLALFFLLGAFFLTAMSSALRRMPKQNAKKELKKLGNLFFYRPLHAFFFQKQKQQELLSAAVCAQNLMRFFYTVCTVLFLIAAGWLSISYVEGRGLTILEWSWIGTGLSLFVFAVLLLFLGDFLPRTLGANYPVVALRTCVPFASVFLYLTFPLTYLFLKTYKLLPQAVHLDHAQAVEADIKQEIIDIIQEADVGVSLDNIDKKLIQSVVAFRNRIAREVMVPRVNLFCLPAETSIKEAARLLEEEGYSRIPVYQNTIDNIIGLLMYKDILKKYMAYEQAEKDSTVLEAPVETIVKEALYAPETKKISHLLQEFRKKQVHLAIVVDEYGGTEGIVTIEDILEEIVGEIADEYDEEEALFVRHPAGGWIIDARMSILDIEEQLGIKIPQEGDYDTVGGYIFHHAGAIPAKGFTIHHDNFNLEVLSSSDRSIEKVSIKPSPAVKESSVENDQNPIP